MLRGKALCEGSKGVSNIGRVRGLEQVRWHELNEFSPCLVRVEMPILHRILRHAARAVYTTHGLERRAEVTREGQTHIEPRSGFRSGASLWACP